MPQSTRRWIAHKVEELRGAPELPFRDLLDPDRVTRALEQNRVRFRDRIFNADYRGGESTLIRDDSRPTSGILEGQPEVVQPGNGRADLVEGRFAQDRVV